MRFAAQLLAYVVALQLVPWEVAHADGPAHTTIVWLKGDNSPIDSSTGSAPISRRITNDDTLALGGAFDQASDVDDVRVELDGIAPPAVVNALVVESIGEAGELRDRQAITWTRGADNKVRSAFVRLVGDTIDRAAEGTEAHTLRVALGDHVRVVATTTAGTLTAEIVVGRPGSEAGSQAARRGTTRVVILREAPGGLPVIGKDDSSAVAIMRDQIRAANQIWLQCFVAIGDPDRAEIVIADPPTAPLLAIADEDGLSAMGGGNIVFRANGAAIDAGATQRGDSPVQTAVRVAEALRRAGFSARITENPPTELGAGRSADVLVRDARGALATLSQDGGRLVSGDRRQTIAIGRVDMADGLAEFNNMTAAAGSLEERTMIKSLADDDPATIDVFVVSRFTFGTRQGEAFIENGGGPIANVVILDRIGLRQQHTAFTLPHEVGHVLLNQPYHPDNIGPDVPWLLMDSDSNIGSVSGPKRLTWDECLRVRAQSENTVPALLVGVSSPQTQQAPLSTKRGRRR